MPLWKKALVAADVVVGILVALTLFLMTAGLVKQRKRGTNSVSKN